MSSTHAMTLDWSRQTPGFGYREYNRNHVWRFDGGQTLQASAATAYLGDARLVNPEEAYAAALSSCHMLTFLALASMKKFVVESYEDHAVAILDKGADGMMMVPKVELSPVIRFSGERQPTAEELAELHHRSHEECFIARSVKTEIIIHIRPAGETS